jgi:ribosome-associated protein
VTRQLTTLARKKLVVSALEDIKARDIVAIDVRKITSMFDWIVVASADSARQTKALARHVRDKLREAGITIIGTEGEEGAEWVLVDTGDIVAHVMQPAVRGYYDLEELWGEGKFDRVVNPTAPLERAARPEGDETDLPLAPPPVRAKRGPAKKAAPRARRKTAGAAQSSGEAPKPRRRRAS